MKLSLLCMAESVFVLLFSTRLNQSLKIKILLFILTGLLEYLSLLIGCLRNIAMNQQLIYVGTR